MTAGVTSEAAANDGDEPLVPGDAGWSLMEAATAIFPQMVQQCWDSDAPAKMFDRLAVNLLRTIMTRSDLIFTGRDISRDYDAERVRMPTDWYTKSFFRLEILDGTLDAKLSDTHRPVRLIEVRIEAVAPRNLPVSMTVAPVPAAQSPQPDEPLGAWRMEFARGHPGSTEKQELKAARSQFGDKNVPRQTIRELRRPSDGTNLRRGRKPGKKVTDFPRK